MITLHRKIMLLSVLMGLLVWLVDSIVDSSVFYGGTFWENLLVQAPLHEVYIRLLILGLFLAFGAIASSLLLRLQRAQRALQERESDLRTTLHSIGDGVISTDVRGHVQRMNTAAEDLTGWKQCEAVGRPLQTVFQIVNAQTRASCENPVDIVLDSGTVQGLANHTVLIARDGRELHIADSAAPIHNDEGDIAGVVLVFRDVTEEHAASLLTEKRLELIDFADSHDLDELLTKVLDDLGSLLHSPIGFYHFVGEDQKSVILQQWSTRTLEEFCAAKGKGLHYPIDQAGVWVDCLREKKPVIHNDYEALPHKRGLPDGHPAVSRELVVPVLREDAIVAFLGLGNKPIDYTERDVEMASFFADVSWSIVQRKQLQEKTEHLNRVLQAIRNVNQLITTERDPSRLIQRACESLIETRGYHNAWIALFDETGAFSETVEAGLGKDFQRIRQQLEQGDLPVCAQMTLERSEVVIVQDTGTTCAGCPLAEEQSERSAMATLLAYGGQTYGLLTVSIPARYAVDVEEHDLFQELAGDLAFALHDLELEEERRKAESEREITLRLLRLLNRTNSLHAFMAEVTRLMQSWAGCDAVGIRLKDGEDYPYFETRGFAKEFVQAESSLCEVDAHGAPVRDSLGNPVLECMCGNVIRGRFDAGLPFFTESGSFWTNSTTDLLASTSDEDRQARTRNRCHGEGYESVVLIPLRHGGETFGLLQLNDSRRNRFTQSQIGLFERLAANLSLGLMQRRVAAALQESEERFRTVLKDLPAGVFAHDLEGRFVLLNDRASQYTGYAKEELLSMTVADIDPESISREDRCRLWHELEHGESTTFESRHVRKDGTVYPVEIHLSSVRLDGQPIMLPVAFDITERKKAELALAASERRFRFIIEDVSNLAIQGYDRNRKVVFWNKASEDLYGYSQEEALGRKLEDLIIPEPMREEVVRDVTRWVEQGVKIPAGELVLEDKFGRQVPVFSSHVMYESLQGSKELFCIDVDLSEVKRIQVELEQAKKAAESSSRAKSEFLANMSHEIRTPLNGILGMLQILQATDLEAEQQEYVDMAVRSSKRLSRLLSDILDLSRIEADKLEIREEAFQLAEVMQSQEDIFRQALRDQGNTLGFRIAPGVPDRLIGDSTRLMQILFNLIGNACKYTAQGQIDVSVSCVSSSQADTCRVLFQVRDTGPGIPSQAIDTIFEAFTQAGSPESPYTRQHEGAGLGLPLVKRLVALMGGNAAITSAEGQGTEVFVCLPFRTPEPLRAEPADQPGGAEPDDLQGARVLLADDDEATQLHVKRLLEKHGASVQVSENGQQALYALSSQAFDCVLMDVQMPVMDGVEATKSIRSSKAGFQNIPVIALTAYAMPGDRERFLAAGMSDYLAKPVDRDDLRATLKRHGVGSSRGMG